MTRNDYLRSLLKALASLQKVERDKTVAFYREMLDDKIEDGMSELEAVKSMESVDAVSYAILSNPENRDKLRQKLGSVTVALLVLGSPLWLSLLITAGALILAVYIVMWSLIAVFFAVDLTLAVGGIVGCAVCVVRLFSGVSGAVFALGAGFVLLALSILMLFPALFTLKYFSALSMSVWSGIVRWIRRKLEKIF